MKSFNHIGTFIKSRRAEVKISQGELSKKLGYKNGQFISNMERGVCSLPVDRIMILSKALNTTPNTIIDAMTKDYRDNLLKLSGAL